MERFFHCLGDIATWALAAAVAAGVLLSASQGRSDGDPRIEAPVAPYPRWSNDHHMQDIWARPDCQRLPPGMAADYIRNTDAWGQPVIPADQPFDFANRLPIGVDGEIYLGSRSVGGKQLDLTAGHISADPSTGAVSLNGFPLSRDCAPPAK